MLPLLWGTSLNKNGTSPDFLPRMESTTDIEIELAQFILELRVYSIQLRVLHLMMYINVFTKPEGIESISMLFPISSTRPKYPTTTASKNCP